MQRKPSMNLSKSASPHSSEFRTHKGIPSDFNCSTHEEILPSVISSSLSSSKGSPKNLPSFTLLDSPKV
eukprot:Skav208906  [mRNA]  locus=scaffold270:622035:622241:+ [translate_table: standard]